MPHQHVSLFNFLFPPLFRLTKHSPTLQKASRNSPHPYLSNCMQNNITLVHCYLTSFREKTILYQFVSKCLFNKFVIMGSPTTLITPNGVTPLTNYEKQKWRPNITLPQMVLIVIKIVFWSYLKQSKEILFYLI